MPTRHRHSARRLLLLTAIVLYILFTLESRATPGAGSAPDFPRAAGDKVYFSADDRVHGRELWQCDASGNCSMVADLQPGPEGSNPAGLVAAGRFLYFQTTSPTHGTRIGYLDTARGVLGNIPLPAGHPKGEPLPGFYPTEEYVAFLMTSANNTIEVWTSAPGSETCAMIYACSFSGEEYAARSAFLFRQVGAWLSCIDANRLIFLGNTEIPAKEINPPAGVTLLRVMENTPDSRTLLAVAGNLEQGVELFRLDSDSGELTLIKDIFPGPGSSAITQENRHGGLLFFAANNDENGLELWRTDGTRDGTKMVLDIAAGRDSSSPYKLCSVADWLYFVADDGVHGAELWRTNSTGKDTRMVCDLNPGVTGAALWSFSAFDKGLYFCAKTPEYGEEVFLTDGTPGGTRVLKDIVPGPGSSGPHNITPFGNMLFFTCDDGVHGEEPWITDGTEQGTRLAMDIAMIIQPPSSNPGHLTAYKNGLIFTANDQVHGNEPWSTDGTEEGTHLLLDINPGKEGSSPRQFFSFGGSVFFSAVTPDLGRELWITGGTHETTRLVLDINAGEKAADPGLLAVAGECLYFSADDDFHGRELWQMKNADNTPELALDITEGAASTPILDIFPLWGNLYLYISEKVQTAVLYRFSEDNDGKRRLVRIKDTSADIQSFVDNGAGDDPDTAVQDILARFIHPPGGTDASHATLPGPTDTLFFSAHTPVHGMELWKTDGTSPGTQLVRDIYPGPASSGPDHLTVFKNRLYFIAETPAEGRILFVSNGTPTITTPINANLGEYIFPPLRTETFAVFNTGLVLVSNLPARSGRAGPTLVFIGESDDAYQITFLRDAPREYALWPRETIGSGNHSFFVFQDDQHGTELWVTDGAVKGTRMVKDINASQ